MCQSAEFEKDRESYSQIWYSRAIQARHCLVGPVGSKKCPRSASKGAGAQRIAERLR
jgi:hypothetical protein